MTCLSKAWHSLRKIKHRVLIYVSRPFVRAYFKHRYTDIVKDRVIDRLYKDLVKDKAKDVKHR